MVTCIIVFSIWGTYAMINKNDELRELVSLVEKFIEFADELKINGKIDEDQYTYITKNKIEFLRETQEQMK